MGKIWSSLAFSSSDTTQENVQTCRKGNLKGRSKKRRGLRSAFHSLSLSSDSGKSHNKAGLSFVDKTRRNIENDILTENDLLLLCAALYYCEHMYCIPSECNCMDKHFSLINDLLQSDLIYPGEPLRIDFNGVKATSHFKHTSTASNAMPTDASHSVDIDNNIKKFVVQYDVNYQNVYGHTALLYVVLSLPRIYPYGSCVFWSPDSYNQYHRTVDLLINVGADVDHTSQDGNFPLWLALLKCDFHAVKSLVNAGCVLNRYHSQEKMSTIYYALRYWFFVVPYLVFHGCDVSSIESKYSPSLLHEVMMESRLPHPEVLIKLLISAGYNPCTSGDWIQSYYLVRVVEDETKKLWNFMKSVCENPLSLKEIARIVIRKQLLRSAGGSSIYGRLTALWRVAKDCPGSSVTTDDNATIDSIPGTSDQNVLPAVPVLPRSIVHYLMLKDIADFEHFERGSVSSLKPTMAASIDDSHSCSVPMKSLRILSRKNFDNENYRIEGENDMTICEPNNKFNASDNDDNLTEYPTNNIKRCTHCSNFFKLSHYKF